MMSIVKRIGETPLKTKLWEQPSTTKTLSGFEVLAQDSWNKIHVAKS